MNILISSLVDLKKSSHNSRLHQFIRYLSKRHEITIISINDFWKVKCDSKSECYLSDFNDIFERVNYVYISNNKISPVLQEIMSPLKKNYIGDMLKDNEYDLHFCYNSLALGNIISRKSNSNNINTIYDIADDLPEMARTSPQIPRLIRPISGLASRLILNDNIKLADKITYTTESLRSSYNLPMDKSIYIPNGVDTELFRNCPSDNLKSNLGIEDYFVIGHVGVLREWLDFKPLFKAIKILSKSQKIKLLLVGGGVGYDETVRLIKEYNILEDSILTGTIPYSKVPKYISCMDACIVPFKLDKVSQNSLPLKLLEYMSCEKPIISTRVNNVVNNFGSFVFFASSYLEYMDKINELISDERLRSHHGSIGRKLAVDKYEWSKIVSKLELLFEVTAS